MKITKDDSKTFQSFFTERIAAMMAVANECRCVSHPGLRGRFREILVSELLSHLVPTSCSITHGTVVDATGERNPIDGQHKTEDDLLIVDRECLPPFFESKNVGIYPIESVIARMEIKSQLTSRSLKDAINGARAFARLEPNVPWTTPKLYCQTPQILFAFETKLAAQKLYEMFRRWSEDNHLQKDNSPPIRHLCIPNIGFWTFTLQEAIDPSWYRCIPQKNSRDDKYSEVLAFLAILLEELPKVREKRKQATLGRYIRCLQENKLEKLS